MNDEAVRTVIVYPSDLPRRFEVINRASTGRSLAMAIGSAVPIAGLFANTAARGVAARGAERREEKLSEYLGVYHPDEVFLEMLRERLADKGMVLIVLEEEREPLPGEVLLRMTSHEFGAARRDKESPYRPAADIQLRVQGPSGRRTVRASCGAEKAEEEMPCPYVSFAGMEDMLGRAEDVRVAGDAMVEALAETATLLVTQGGKGAGSP